MKYRIVLTMLLASFLVAGCANLAPPETDTLAKLMQPVSDKAVVYLFRNEPASAPWQITVRMDGKEMGETRANTYFRWVIEPGRHVITSEADNEAGLVLDAEPGRIYYVWQDIQFGFFQPRTELQLVDQQTAEIALRSCYMLQGEG